MNKKLLIAAVGAALVAGVSATQADVKVSGTGHMSLDSIKGCKDTACTSNSTNWDVSSNASNVIISANEDLGGGLKGIFQWQEFVRLDNNNNGNSGSATANNQLSGGNSAVGLGGDWGSVNLGNWDSGAKQNGAAFDLFNNQIGDSRNADRANNRIANLLWYVSPNMSGFSAILGHSTNTDHSPTNDNSTSADTLIAKYAQGPLLVGVGFDKLKVNGTTVGDGDKWTNIGGKYTLPSDTSLILFYQKHDNVGLDSNISTKTTGIGVAQKFGGNNTVKLQYYTVKAEDSSPGGGSVKPKLLAVGVDHNFSKTFTGYVAYAQAKNDSNCTGIGCMSMAGGGHGDNPGTADGEKMSGFSFGAIYNF